MPFTTPRTTRPTLARTAIQAPLAALLVAGAIALHVGVAAPARAYPPSLIPADGAYVGSWVAPRAGESTRTALERVEEQIGRAFDIDHQYYKWNANLPTPHQLWDVRHGRIPFVNWNARRSDGSVVRWSSIADGSQDAWIRDRADAFRAFGRPIYLAFHHEPENDLSAFGTPAEYAAAFRRVVRVFRSRNVDNVAFVWTMMSWTFDEHSGRNPEAYYPGDRYVDVVGSDGYNWYPGRRSARWASFEDVFEPTNDFARAHDKPVIAVEYGVQEDPSVPGRKAEWFADALATVADWPRFKAVIYFDETTSGFEWVTDSSSSSMSAYAALATDPYMRVR
jgi:hypothetical protein